MSAMRVPEPRVCEATCVRSGAWRSKTSGKGSIDALPSGVANTNASANPMLSAGMSSTCAYGPCTTQSTSRCRKSPSKLSNAKSCWRRSSTVGSVYSSSQLCMASMSSAYTVSGISTMPSSKNMSTTESWRPRSMDRVVSATLQAALTASRAKIRGISSL